ncbi:MAG: alpha/beta fold hydrolase [Bacteroidetes bacterium]|nr:MAG: alpha/beta fold hydrolase [Bacteroidota bacterium]
MKLFFRDVGSGPVFIIVHGLFGISDNWFTLGKRFGERFRVLIPDLRNHGRSPRSAVFDFPLMEEDVLELIRNLKTGWSVSSWQVDQYRSTFRLETADSIFRMMTLLPSG